MSTTDYEDDTLGGRCGRMFRLYADIERQLRSVEAICRDSSSDRSALAGPLEFYQCDTATIGTTVEEWIIARKKLAIHRDVGKKVLDVAVTKRKDPYGLCPYSQQGGKEYFVLDPGSGTWIAFRDLTPGIAGIMRWNVSRRYRRPLLLKLDRADVQLPLEPRFDDSGDSNLIPFRRREVVQRNES